jgi:hypothetical protein
MVTPHSGFRARVERVSQDEIRRIFNEGQYERTQSGELITILMKNNHPERPIPGEPRCRHSQMWFYYTRRRELVAVVHQYQRPDGTLGLSGKPDPKKLYLEDRIVYVPSKSSE